MRVELIETRNALQALEPVWESLWLGDPAADIFASFDWFLNWWEHFGHSTGPDVLVVRDGDRWVSLPGRGTRLHVLVVWDQDEAVAIAPLILVQGWWRRCPVRLLAPPLNAHAPRSGFLTSRAPRAAVAAMVEYLAGSRQWDMLLLDGIPRQSGLMPALREAAAGGLRPGRRQLPWSHAYLALEGTWEQYLARQKRHFRKHLWQAERALTRLGTVTVERYDRPDTVPTGMQVFMDIDGESWKAQEGESIALHPAVGAYYADLAERFAKRQRCEIWALKIADEPAAAFLCLRDARILYTLKTSYKEKFASAQYSPSIVLLARIIQEAWEKKLSSIDFVGRMPFVERWTAAGQEFDQFVAFRRHPYMDLVRLADWTKRYAGRVQHFLDSHLR